MAALGQRGLRHAIGFWGIACCGCVVLHKNIGGSCEHAPGFELLSHVGRSPVGVSANVPAALQ